MKPVMMFVPIMLATSVTLAEAQEAKRIYGGIEYGAAKIKNEAQDVANDFVSLFGGSATVTQDTSIGVGRVFLGYRIDERFSVEAGLFQSGDANLSVRGTTGLGAAYSVNGSVDYQGVDVSALWFPMATKMGESGIFLKLGIHSAKVSSSGSITGTGGTASFSDSSSGVGSLFGLGYDWNFAGDAFVRLGVSRYLRVGGDSGNDATVYSIGIGTAF